MKRKKKLSRRKQSIGGDKIKAAYVKKFKGEERKGLKKLCRRQ